MQRHLQTIAPVTCSRQRSRRDSHIRLHTSMSPWHGIRLHTSMSQVARFDFQCFVLSRKCFVLSFREHKVAPTTKKVVVGCSLHLYLLPLAVGADAALQHRVCAHDTLRHEGRRMQEERVLVQLGVMQARRECVKLTLHSRLGAHKRLQACCHRLASPSSCTVCARERQGWGEITHTHRISQKILANKV